MKRAVAAMFDAVDVATETKAEPRVLAACRSCNGDPGGIVWEGMVLTGLLTSADITQLLRGILTQEGVARLFKTGALRGLKIGRQWVTRASTWTEDWDALESARIRRAVQRRRSARKGRTR